LLNNGIVFFQAKEFKIRDKLSGKNILILFIFRK